jgi:hypothetical protein
MQNNFDLNYPTANVAAACVSASQVAAIKSQVQQAWARGKEYRLQTGELLLQLRQALSVKGHGKFGDALAELGIKRSTARDYIDLYRVSKGWQQPKRKSGKRGIRTYEIVQIHDLKDVAGAFFRRRPEDIAAFWEWLAENHPFPSEK